MEKYDFSGWVTRNDIRCTDGRIIRRDAFMHHDGQVLPLVWNHDYSGPDRIIGKILLENREEGVYGYGSFNKTELAHTAKICVDHGDITGLSIHANQLQQQGPNVMHGRLIEVSLVLAGANPGAHIENVIKHGAEIENEVHIYTGEEIQLYHADDYENPEEEGVEIMIDEGKVIDETVDDNDLKDDGNLSHSDTETKDSETKDTETKDSETKDTDSKESEGKSIKEIYDAMTDEQKGAVQALVGVALDDSDDDENDNKEGDDETMKHNVFDKETQPKSNTLTHSDQQAIIALAKSPGVGDLKTAMEIYAEEHSELSHGWEAESMEALFPDYKNFKPGAPELVERDQSWVASVMNKAHKSPFSRIRTRQADARANELRAKGYNSRAAQKTLSGDISLIMRTFDPQTVYRRDELHRDDIIDITDFDVVAYQKMIMRHNLEEDIALAMLIGDGREDTDPDKVHENHIRSIWNDDEIYTIHKDVDIAAARAELQGTNTGANFGDNYIYAEAIITAALYAREKYKGKGTLDFYCTPHLLNVMLLARDLNGRRIYDSKADLAKALNVGEIHTVEQFEEKTRTTKQGAVKKLLGIFVNMNNYTIGSTKGGEITNFEDFNINFNKYEYLMETRLSGALTELASAIALEEPVVTEEDDEVAAG